MKNASFKKHVRRFASVALAGQMLLLTLSGCSLKGFNKNIDTTGGKPWICSDLQENLTPDLTLSPVDDFHLYVNYDWASKAVIPEGYSGYGVHSMVYDETMKKATAILTDDTLEGHDIELIQSFYNNFLDWETRDALGVTPAQETVDDILSIDSIEEYSEFICDHERTDCVPDLLYFSNDADLYESEKYVSWFAFGGFVLGDAAEYKKRTEQGDRYYEGFLSLHKAMLGRFGYSEDEAKKMFDEVISFEGKVADSSLTSADYMGTDIMDKIYNVYTLEELEDFAPNLPIRELAVNYGYGETTKIVVTEPKQLERLNDLYTEENLEALKAYLLVRYLRVMSRWLDSEALDANLSAANIIYGSTGRQSDEELAFGFVREYLSTPMDRAYVEYYDCSKTKERITEVCEKVIDSYREIISEEDWLSEETKETAIEKLDNIKINAVYPDKWEDFSDLDFTGLSLVESVVAIGDFYLELDAKRTNGLVDNDIWDFDILEANAYYDASDNSINIILGLLGDPYYYEGISDEELYGGIGMVIGHEVCHAFDTNGAQFDKDGNYVFWWTDDDYKAFTSRAEKLIKYYDKIEVWKGQSVIGKNVQTEAIADMGGMKAVLNIADDIDGFDYDKFFTAYSISWREIESRESVYDILTQDPHPLCYLRVNSVVQQFQEFYDTYGVKEGDGMYLAPEDRVAVW